MLGNRCNNVNMGDLTTKVTVVLTSRPRYNSQLNVHVDRIKRPKYTTTRDPGGRGTVVQFLYVMIQVLLRSSGRMGFVKLCG